MGQHAPADSQTCAPARSVETFPQYPQHRLFVGSALLSTPDPLPSLAPPVIQWRLRVVSLFGGSPDGHQVREARSTAHHGPPRTKRVGMPWLNFPASWRLS